MPTDTPVVDAAQRLRALNPSQSFIVQAPAGSGKTALLTRRVLTLLATVDEPEEILSITFTRKAAAEMRDRVVEALHKAANEPEPETAFEKEGFDLAKTVLNRDKKLDWQLLQNTDRLRMSTIDSLCSMLAQQLPVTSTLGGVANPVDDARALYKDAARARLKLDSDNYRYLLMTVGNRFENAEILLAAMLGTRDQWLRYRTLFSVEDRGVLRDWLQDQLQGLVVRELGAFEQLLKDNAVEHLIKSSLLPLLQQASIAMDRTGQMRPADKVVREKFGGLTEVPEFAAGNLGIWQAILSCVLTTGGTVRKSVTRNVGFPTTKKDLDLVGITAEEGGLRKEAMTNLLRALADAPDVELAIKQVLALPQAQYAEHQWELLNELITELPSLERALHKVFIRHGAIDFIEIAMRAEMALGTADEPTDLALAMDLRLKHILVDEFQDTSRTQFNLFRQLVAGWEKGDGRTFFVVGDPMQSIYSFRAAEVSLFGTAQTHGISADVQLEPLTLKVNFRSSPDVVNWVNESFESIFVAEADADASVGAIAYSPSVSNRSIAGNVQIHPMLNASAAAAAERVADVVEQCINSAEFAEDPSRRVAILVRSKAAASPIFLALQKREIPNLSIDMDSLGDQPVVMDLVSLTIALRLPHSRLHWLAILRAPWCGLGLEDLHVLTADAPRTKAMHLLINDEQRLNKLSHAGRARLEQFLRVLQPAIDRASRTSLISWVEAVWLQLGGPVLCVKPTDKNAAQRCLKVLYELEASGELWKPASIQAAMDGLFAITPDDGNTKVHIMTMHKSKGLEFDTVILPALNRQPKAGDNPLLDWAVVDADGGGDPALLLAPMTERNAPDQDKALGKLVKKLKSSSDDQENRRLLYVACTRAVRQLHLMAPLNITKKGINAPSRSLLEPLWPCVVDDFNAALAEFEADKSGSDQGDDIQESGAQATSPAPPTLERVPENWVVPNLPNFNVDELSKAEDRSEDQSQSVDYLWAGRSARVVGTVVHRHMERFHTHGLPSVETVEALKPIVIRQLQQEGVSGNECAKLCATVIDTLEKVAADETGQWLFDPSHIEPRAEWALTTHADEKTERRVIDRTFLDKDGTRWVVDFKTGDHKGGDLEGFLQSEVERHSSQLRRYGEILCSLKSAPVKLALYFPLLQAFREVPLA